MRRVFSPCAVLACVSSILVAAACSSSGTSGGPQPSAPPSPTATSRDGAAAPSAEADASSPGKPANVDESAPSCANPEACPYWYCDCGEGPPINTRHCTNGKCEDARTACPSSCKSFKTCWTGHASGGWDGGTNAGPDECHPTVPAEAGTGCGDATSFTDIGKACANGPQCQSGQCYGVSPSFLCTKRCTTASHCPLHWKCEKNGDGFQVCMQGGLSTTGSVPSTNAACGQVGFTDLGQACSGPANCQSSICLGSSLCSRRCEVAADCPAGWSCTTGANFKFCTK